MRHFMLIMVGLAGASAGANGQSVRTLVTYKGPDPTTCTAPPLTQSFSSSDASVNAYFLLDGLSPGQTVELHWFDQTNAYKWYERWDPVPNGSSSRCYWVDLNIASYIAPNWGSWTVQVYVDGQAIGSAIGFQVSSGPVEPRGPEYVGYFDPIEPGCSHLTGWAKDNGNPNAVVSVDIRVEGGMPPFPIIQATEAGKYRTGVGNYEWNLYNLQLYEDGQSHLVHVLYHGSPLELPGSPRYFPPPGALSTCNGGVSPLIRVGHVVTLPNSNGTVYYVHSTGLYPFATADAFYSWGFQFSDVTTANGAEAALPIQTIIIPAKIPGCSDPIAQINGTCGSTPLSVNWVSESGPPQSMTSGQSYQVKWQMAGPAQIQSRLCYGSSSDPATMCQQNATYWQNTGTNTSGVGTDFITAPMVTSAQTVYAVVQAQANGQTANTQPAAITVRPATPTGPTIPTWTYSTDPNLRGLTAIVQQQITGTSYQYRFNIISNSGFSSDIATAHLTIIAPHDSSIKVHRTSLNAQVIYDNGASAQQIIQSVDSAPWVGLNQAWNNYTILAKDILGFVPLVGQVLAVDQLVKDALTAANLIGGIGPSPALNSELNSDDYDVYGADVSIGPFLGVRISVNVDQFGSTMPHFFLTLKESGTTVVGIELRDTKGTGACPTPGAIGSNGVCWLPWIQSIN